MLAPLGVAFSPQEEVNASEVILLSGRKKANSNASRVF